MPLDVHKPAARTSAVVCHACDRSRSTSSAPRTTSPTDGSVVRLLQSFDEYVVGYRDSRDVIDLSGAEAARRGTPGLPSALVIVDGQIAGRWLRRVRAAQVDVEVALHRPFDEAEAVALQAEVDRHAAALGRSATLITSTV